VKAVEAGIDILLHPVDAYDTIDAVVAAVEQGRITRQRITESVERIMAAKKKLGLFEKKRRISVQHDLRKHARIAQEIGRKSVRILSGDKKLLPISPKAGVACFVLDDDNNTESGNTFIHAMRDHFRHLSVIVLTPGTEMPESLVLDSIRGAEAVVIAFFSRISAAKGHSGISQKLRDMAIKILRTNRELRGSSFLVSFDSPYLLDQFHEADVRIAAYDRLVDIQAAAADLIGLSKP
jgi:beta-N-acetylhexosaminidase